MRMLPPAAAMLTARDAISAGLRSAVARDDIQNTADELKSYLGASDLFFLSSGKAALTVTLCALASMTPRRAIAIPAYTCFTVPAAIVRAGLEPVLVDIDPATMDFEKCSLARTLDRPDLLAVVPTHLFGIPADVARVRELAQARGVFVLEDAAQGLGLVNKVGRRLGTLGDASVFSLARGKHVTAGTGGIIATSSPHLADAIRRTAADVAEATTIDNFRLWLDLAVMSVFTNPRLYWIPAGLPFLGLGETKYEPDFRIARLPSVAAAALRGWRSRLEAANRLREQSVEAWRTVLGEAIPDVCRGALVRLPVVLASASQRTAVLETSRAHGLGVSAMYPSAINHIPELAPRFTGARYPGAEMLAGRLVTLPTHRFVRDRDRQAVKDLWPSSIAVGSTAYPEAASC